MAITLVATPGASNANTFCTLASANAFLEQNIHAYATWATSSTTNQNACLVWATRLLDDQIDWDGYKSDPLGIGEENQALRFPRKGLYDRDGDEIDEDTIPTFMVQATAEYARYLLSSDRTADHDTYGFKRLKVDVIELEIDKYDRRPTMPLSVWEMVKFYGTRARGKPRVLERM